MPEKIIYRVPRDMPKLPASEGDFLLDPQDGTPLCIMRELPPYALTQALRGELGPPVAPAGLRLL